MWQGMEICPNISSVKRVHSMTVPWQGYFCLCPPYARRSISLLGCHNDIIEEKALGWGKLNAAPARSYDTKHIGGPGSPLHREGAIVNDRSISAIDTDIQRRAITTRVPTSSPERQGHRISRKGDRRRKDATRSCLTAISKLSTLVGTIHIRT